MDPVKAPAARPALQPLCGGKDTMPTTYAHYRFGQDVLRRLSTGPEKPILRRKELFDCGLHGPDLLFYYKALSKNPVNTLGNEMHSQSARAFFEPAGRVIAAKPHQNSHLAYVYGFICHFALDRCCHAFINAYTEESGVSHLGIEAEFDRYLMEKDGLDPLRQLLTGHVVPSDFNAEIIADFYPELDRQQVLDAMKGFVFYLNQLVAPPGLKRKALMTALKAAGQSGLQDLFIPETPHPACAASNERLEQLYAQALEEAVKLICEFRDSAAGLCPWNELYDFNFNSILVGSEA